MTAPASDATAAQSAEASTTAVFRSGFVLIASAVWFSLAITLRDPLYDVWAVVATTAVLFATLGFWQWKPTERSADLRIIGIAVCSQTFLTSGLSIIRTVDRRDLVAPPTTEAFSGAVLIAAAFAFAFITGVALVMRALPRRRDFEPVDAAEGVPPWLVAVTAAYGIIHETSIGAAIGESLGTLPLTLLSPTMLVGALVAVDRNRTRAWWLIGVLFAAQAISAYRTSLLGPLLLLAQQLFLGMMYMRRRIPRSIIVAVLFVFGVINPAKHHVRSEVAAGHTDGSASQTAQLWMEGVTATWSDGQERDTRESALGTTAKRIDYNPVAAQVLGFVPRMMPFLDGATYEVIPFVLQPRILFPDKPDTGPVARARWTVLLGLQTSDSARRTSIAIPAAAEAYWNYGWSGVFGVGFIVGLCIGLLMGLAPANRSARTGYLLIVCATLAQFADMLFNIVPGLVLIAGSAVLIRVYVLGFGVNLRAGPTTRADSLTVDSNAA